MVRAREGDTADYGDGQWERTGKTSVKHTEEKGDIWWNWEGGLVCKALTVQAWGPEIRSLAPVFRARHVPVTPVLGKRGRGRRILGSCWPASLTGELQFQ